MNLAPGSLAWLLAQQLRVSWRGFRTPWLLWALGAVVLLEVGLSLTYAATLREIGQAVPELSPVSGWPLLIAGLLSVFLFTVLLSQAISGTLETLFERGDLDLLLVSPLPVSRVLTARLLGVLLSALPIFAGLALLITIPALVAGVWRVLGLWPWLLSLALLATAFGAALTLGLVKVLGVRRARTVAGILGAVSGAAFFLVSQAGNLSGSFSGQRQNAVTRWITNVDPAQVPFVQTPLWWPARTLWLEGLPTLGTLALALLIFALVSATLARIYGQGAQAALTHAAPQSAAHRQAGPLRFAQGRRAILLKEWRLLGRDSLLLSRTLLSVLYLLPMGFVLLRGSGDDLTVRLVGFVSILALGNLTFSLATITANAEDAPDVLRGSPTPLGQLRWLKVWAAALPVLAVWAVFLLLSITLLPGALAGLGLGLVSILGCALIVLHRPLELRRADLMQRRQQRGDWVASIACLALQAGLLGALYWLPSPNGLAALVAALLIPTVAVLVARRTTFNLARG